METTVVPAAGRGVATSSAARTGNLTVRELVDAYMAAYDGRDGTRCARLAWWVEQIGDVRVADLGDDHIHFALEALAEGRPRRYMGLDADGRAIYRAVAPRRAPATVNRYHAALSAVLSWAIRRRLTPRDWDNPCRRVERRPERNSMERYLSADERGRLLAACRASRWPRLYLLVLMAITTGARKGELLQLRWGDLDLASPQPVAHLPRTKNGKPRVLPLTAPVVDQLRALPKADPRGLLFASRQRPNQPRNIEWLWRQALRTAGIRNFRFHDLRHTCASYLAQSGASLLQIADVLGHRSLAVTQRYSHLTVRDKSTLVNAVLGDLR